MNKLIKIPALLLCGAAFALGFSSCSDDNNGNGSSNEKKEQMNEILSQYVNNTVYATYSKLADIDRFFHHIIPSLYHKPSVSPHY